MSVITPYKPLPVNFERGEGVWLYDKEGKQYLDALAGIAVCSLGHSHPSVTETICNQAGRLMHTSNLYGIDNQVKLAQELTTITGMDQVFFANSGAEANEAAIKLVRLYGHQKNIDKPAIIVMEKAFHGRTMATLTASGSRKVQAGFEPLLPGFIRAPYNDLAALETIAQNTQEVVAIMVEPVQGEGGVHVPDENYLAGIRKICDEHDWLMILDEVQTGIGRTGKFFAFQHENITPDIVTSAKALGNGYPIGACIIGGRATDLFQPGMHGSTYGGNPLACAVASTVVETFQKDNLAEHAAQMGEYLMKGLSEALQDNPHVTAIRGKGLMVGVELDTPCRELLKIGLQHGLLFGITAESVVRLLPPLIISREEVDELVTRLCVCINEFFS